MGVDELVVRGDNGFLQNSFLKRPCKWILILFVLRAYIFLFYVRLRLYVSLSVEFIALVLLFGMELSVSHFKVNLVRIILYVYKQEKEGSYAY